MTVLHQNMLKQVSRAVLCFISSDLSSWGLISDDLLLVFSSCCLQKRQTAGTGERGLFRGGRGSHQPQIVSSCCCSHCWLLICQTSSCSIHLINVRASLSLSLTRCPVFFMLPSEYIHFDCRYLVVYCANHCFCMNLLFVIIVSVCMQGLRAGRNDAEGECCLFVS